MKIKINGAKATVDAKPTPRILSILPRLEGRRSWLKEGGLSFENTPHNLRVLSGAGAEIETGDAAAEAFDGLADAQALLSYSPKVEDYWWQARAKERIGDKNVFALFMEQGTGKTKVAIDQVGRLYAAGKITGVLIVSKKGVHRQWVKTEIPKHINCDHEAGFWDQKESSMVPSLLDPTGALKIYSVNIDAVRYSRVAKVIRPFLDAHNGRLMVILDESQTIMNRKSARSKAMDEIKPFSSHRMILTGTPIAKNFEDEWAQLYWLDERIIGIKYVTAFRSEFCMMGGFQGRAVVGQKNVAAFRKLTDPFSFRVTKEDVGQMPKVHNEWTFDLLPVQKNLIKEVKDELRASLESGEEIELTTAIAAMGKVQQISSGFIIDEDGTVHPVVKPEANPRLEAAMDWVEAGSGAKFMIWARFKEDLRLLAETLRAKGVSVVEYHGGISEKDREEAVRSFLDPEGAQGFIANPASAGTGLNLQGLCLRALYYTNSFNAIDRWQSEDRIHRIGTIGICVYTDLIAPGTIDRKLVANLRSKKGISELAIGEFVYDDEL